MKMEKKTMNIIDQDNELNQKKIYEQYKNKVELSIENH